MMNDKELLRLVSDQFTFNFSFYIFNSLAKLWFLHLDDINESPRASNHSIFSIEFYQKFFDVDAGIVKERFMSAIVPRRAPVNYMKQDIGPNPDLYGPFWIVVTLVSKQRTYLIRFKFIISFVIYFVHRFFVSQLAVTLPIIYRRHKRISIGITISIWYQLQQQQLLFTLY